MTKSAIEQAAEALRKEWSGMDRFVSKILVTDQTNPGGPKVIDAYRVSSGAWLMLQARIRHVIDALTAEQARVPPDRERLHNELMEMVEDRRVHERDREWVTKSAAALRIPAPAECEEMAAVMEMLGNRANDAHEEWNGSDVSLPVSLGLLRDARRLVPVLRRLSPAEGWRPISFNAGAATTSELQSEIGRLQAILHRRVLGDPRVSVGSQPLPSPPAEEEKT